MGARGSSTSETMKYNEFKGQNTTQHDDRQVNSKKYSFHFIKSSNKKVHLDECDRPLQHLAGWYSIALQQALSLVQLYSSGLTSQ